MKDKAVVKVAITARTLAAFSQIDKIPHGFRTLFGIKLNLKGTLIGFKNRRRPFDVFFVVTLGCHVSLLFGYFI
jgi:hypothetical protein